jgi:hypothetical protein
MNRNKLKKISGIFQEMKIFQQRQQQQKQQKHTNGRFEQDFFGVCVCVFIFIARCVSNIS